MHRELTKKLVILILTPILIGVFIINSEISVFNSSTHDIERTDASLDVEYTGQPCVHSTKNGDLFLWSTADATLSLEYYIDPFGTPTDTSTGAAYELGPPANEGSYYMSGILKSADGTQLASTPILPFTINPSSNPIEPTPTLKPTGKSLDVAYTGTAVSHSTVNGNLFVWTGNGTLSYEYYNSNLEPTTTPPVSPGKYYLVARLDYTTGTIYSDMLEFSILSTDPNLRQILQIPDTPYTGSRLSISTAKGKFFTWDGNGTLSLQFFKDKLCTLPTDTADGSAVIGGAPSKPNQYYIKAQLSSSGNYSEDSITGIAVAISKGTLPAKNETTISLPTSQNHSSTHDLFALFDIPKIAGTWKLLDADTVLGKVALTPNGKLSINGNISKPTTASVYAKFTPNELYLPHTAVLNLSFVERNTVNLSVSVQDKSFDGLQITPLIKIDGKDYTVDQFGGLKLDYYTDGNTPLSTAPTTPGQYKLIAVVDSADSTSNTVTVNFNIYPKVVELKNISAKDKPFDGTNVAQVAFDKVNISGLVTGFDNVKLDYANMSAKFENIFTGGRILVNKLSLTGGDAGCYSLQNIELNAEILPVPPKGVVAVGGSALVRTNYEDPKFGTIFSAYPTGITSKFKTAEQLRDFMHQSARDMFSESDIKDYELFDISFQPQDTEFQLAIGSNSSFTPKLIHILPDGSIENVPVLSLSCGITTANKVSKGPFMLLYMEKKPSPIYPDFPILPDEGDYTLDPDTYWLYILQKLIDAKNRDTIVVEDIGLEPPQYILDILRDRPTLMLILVSKSSPHRVYSGMNMRVPNPPTGW